MRSERNARAIHTARKLLRQIWEKRDKLWSHHIDPEDIFPLDVPMVVQNLLEIYVEEPEEIPVAEERIEIAGYIDRNQNTIVVAQKYKAQWRRFTWAHELGHYLLHPALSYRRERPLTGAERSDYRRSSEEIEADAFAAELLMPTKLLNKVFRESFGHPIDGRRPNQDLAFWLSVASPTKIEPSVLAERGPRYRAMLIAQAKTWQGSFFIPLADRFGVSPTAMAIQLVELGLVR